MAMDLTFGKFVNYILGFLLLVVLIGGVVTFFTPLGTKLGQWVNTVLDLGTSPVPFTGDREEITTATASVHALLYSINKVAWYDTYTSRNQEIVNMAKEFRGSKALPVYGQREKIAVGSSAKDNALEELTRRVVDCKKIYDDRGRENSGCFTFDFAGFTATISEQDFRSFAARYRDTPSCDEDCKSILGQVLGGFLNPRNYVFSLQGDNTISSGDEVKICAQKPGFLGAYKIYITDSDIDAAKICQLPEEEMDFGMKVVNFHLPQEINTYEDLTGPGAGIVRWGETWVRTHGDPEYLLFYEIFPKGEESYWLPQAYVVDVAQILTIEGVFLAIDLIPYAGKPIGAVLDKIGAKAVISNFLQDLSEKLIGKTGGAAAKEALQGSRNLFTRLKSLLQGSINLFFERASDRIMTRILGRELAVEGTEEVAERIVGEYVQALPRTIDISRLTEQLGQETKILHDLFLEDGREVFLPNGRFTDDFLSELTDHFRLSIKEAGARRNALGEIIEYTIPEQVLDNIAERTSNELSQRILKEANNPLRRLIRLADGSNNKVINKLKTIWNDVGISTREKEDFVRDLYVEADVLERLTPAEIRRISANSDKAIEYALEMQDLNPDFIQEVLGSSFQGDASRLPREEASRLLDERFETVLRDINPTAWGSGKLQALLTRFAGKKRHLITALAVYSNVLEDSMGEKFIPVGTNAIGLRTPFLATTIYNDEYTASYDYSRDASTYRDFFRYYEGYVEGKEEIDESYLRYQGLLPEVNRYFIALVKDKGTTFEQANQRLHLASPCKADIVVTKTKCECWGSPREDTKGQTAWPSLIAPIFEHDGIYETGQYNEYYERVIESFDGESEMLYTVGVNGKLVKECYPKNLGEHITFWEDSVYKPSCIEINPILDEELEYNYCYHGLTTPGMRAADIILNWGLPIGGAIACAGSGPGAAICGALGGVFGTFTYAWINTGHQWPNHN